VSPYRQNVAPPIIAPVVRRWTLKDWWNCHIRDKHVLGMCLIDCPLEDCSHRCCIFCGDFPAGAKIPQSKPHSKDIFATLVWHVPCWHDWRAFDADEGPAMQQCRLCTEQRPQRFPAELP
jgi:hypothetical protein